jgi:hypothetical protein
VSRRKGAIAPAATAASLKETHAAHLPQRQGAGTITGRSGRDGIDGAGGRGVGGGLPGGSAGAGVIEFQRRDRRDRIAFDDFSRAEVQRLVAAARRAGGDGVPTMAPGAVIALEDVNRADLGRPTSCDEPGRPAGCRRRVAARASGPSLPCEGRRGLGQARRM